MVRSVGGSLGLLVCLLVAASGCDKWDSLPDSGFGGIPGRDVPFDSYDPGLPQGPFAAPEGIAVAGGYVFVANANFAFEGQELVFGPGFVTVVRASDGSVVNRIRTSGKNPQVVLANGDEVLVLCSGETVYDPDTLLVRPRSDGAIDIIDLAEAETASRPSSTIPIPRGAAGSLVGYPSSLVVTSDGRYAYVASGTAAALFKVDLQDGTVVRGADYPIELGDLQKQDTVRVAKGPDGLLLLGRFNNDLVHLLDPVTDRLATFPWGTLQIGSSGAFAGVSDLVHRPGNPPDLFVLLGLAGQVAAVTMDAGAAGVQVAFASTGLYPNRLLSVEGKLLVVNSGENNVTAIHPSTGAILDWKATLPPSTNPYDATVDGPTLWVTGLVSNSLHAFSLATGKSIRVIQ
jgi:DNA-binding beta-propeller fold protein YncE